jgi:NitT/TauT family transport system substrate-binding protein
VIVAHEDFLATHKPEAVKLLRCIAKATIFGLNNTEKTIKTHWELYPATKPEGDEETAMKKARIVFESRFSGFQVPPGVKWGENLESQWKGVAKLMQQEKLLPDDFNVTASYTNEFIDEINNFDAKAVAEEAKAAK